MAASFSLLWRFGLVAAFVFMATPAVMAQSLDWSEWELATLRSLWIGGLPALPKDPSNAVGDDEFASELGHQFFFDTRFSADEQESCATCHLPAMAFTDGRKQGRGAGTTRRNTMPIAGTAYSPWFFWDGRKDSQWSQALAPLESPVEHNITRSEIAHLIAAEPGYKAGFERLFGGFPDLSNPDRFPTKAGPFGDASEVAAWQAMEPGDRDTINRVFAGFGKVIAAYERRLQPGPSRFDRYVEAVVSGERQDPPILSREEEAGLRLFMGRGQCTQCHNGPLFSNNDFHNTGVRQALGAGPDRGRSDGVEMALADEFNCQGRYSDAQAGDCGELRFAKTQGPELLGAMKTPTLRNVSQTWPYMHSGQYPTLELVLEHYNRAPKAPTGTSELSPLGFNEAELHQLKLFLLTLDSPVAIDGEFLTPPN